MGSIEAFKARLNGGIVKPNRFVVNIQIPKAFGGGTAGTPGVSASTIAGIFSTCEIAQFPTSNIATKEDMIWGPVRKMPYNKTYDDLRLTFICTNNMIERDLFDRWQNLVVDRVSNYCQFYDDYVSSIQISVIGERDNVLYTVECEECYPLAISAQELNSEIQNAYLKLEVVFAYRHYTIAY